MMNGSSRDGFSLVEVIVAMMILTFGVLALSASTGYVMNQIRSADVRTERVAALSEASERLRAIAFNNVPAECQAFTYSTENFTVTCVQETGSANMRRVRLVAEGPGYRSGQFVPSMEHAIVVSVAR